MNRLVPLSILYEIYKLDFFEITKLTKIFLATNSQHTEKKVAIVMGIESMSIIRLNCQMNCHRTRHKKGYFYCSVYNTAYI